MNSSAQLSSSKRFWSLLLSWLKDGMDRHHRTARKSSLAADSKTISWLVGVPADDVVGNWMVKISSELLTSSSFPLIISLVDFVGNDNKGKVNGLGRRGLNSLFDEKGEMYRLKYGFTSKAVLVGKVEFPAIVAGGGGGKRQPFDAAKCIESMTFDWNELKCG